MYSVGLNTVCFLVSDFPVSLLMSNMFVVALVPFKSHCYFFKNLFRSWYCYNKTGSGLTWTNFTKPRYYVSKAVKQIRSDAGQCSRLATLFHRGVINFVERLHKMVIFHAAMLTLHSTTVVAVVLEGGTVAPTNAAVAPRTMQLKYRLMTLLTVKSDVTARRSGKYVVGIHCTDEQSSTGPRSTAVTTSQIYRRAVHTSEHKNIIIITAWAVATSCCISDVSSQWEGVIFDPP